jgi:DNA mismatch endonuclease (patch repair protein)
MEEQFARHRNPDFWIKKIRRNVQRDTEVTAELIAAGWRVIRIWESEIKSNPGAAADRVEEAVKASP